MVLFRKSLDGTPLKKSTGLVRSRLLPAAVGCSVLLHVTAIGGWALLEKGRGAHRDRSPSMEIKVKIVQGSADPDHPARREPVSSVSGSGADASASVPARSAAPEAVSANRLLSDPATGLIFSVYFKAVKAHLARQAASVGFAADEDVTVHFVLSRTGQLKAVSTPPGTPAAVQRAAFRLLSAAEPFPPFPSSIQHASIAFEVLFRCDRNVLR